MVTYANRDKCIVTLVNSSAASVTFQCLANQRSYVCSPTPLLNFSATNVGVGISGTIPAGSRRYFAMNPASYVTNVSEYGQKSVTVSVTCTVNGVAKTLTGAPKTVLLSSQAAGPYNLTGSGTTLPYIGMYDLGGGNPTDSTYIQFAELVVAAAPHGSITVNNLKGNYHAELKLDGNKIAEGDQVPVPITNSTAPGPPLTWTTLTPTPYVGKNLELWVNGMMCYKTTIVADTSGNFDYVLSFDWEFTQRIMSEDVEVPLPGDTPVDPWGTDESHSRPEPGALSGPDPKTDTATTAMNPGNTYRAVRAAIEDSLGGAGPSGDFSFDQWSKGDNMGDQGAGAVGNALGGALGAFGQEGMPNNFGGGLGQQWNYTIHTNLGSLELGIAAWAGPIRTFFLIIASWYFWRALVHTLRGSVTTVS